MDRGIRAALNWLADHGLQLPTEEEKFLFSNNCSLGILIPCLQA